MMTLETSVAIIAFAWVVLVIYLIFTLVQLRKVLLSSNRSIQKVEDILKPIDSEASKLLGTSNALAENFLEKSKALDPVFHTVSQLSQTADEMVSNLRKSNTPLAFTEKKASTVENLMELAALGILLWSKYKKGP